MPECLLPSNKQLHHLLQLAEQHEVQRVLIEFPDRLARFGYRYKEAWTAEERIITAAVVTAGEKNDGKQLQALIVKSKVAGVDVKIVIGDAAYSEKENIKYSHDNDIELVAKINPLITQ